MITMRELHKKGETSQFHQKEVKGYEEIRQEVSSHFFSGCVDIGNIVPGTRRGGRKCRRQTGTCGNNRGGGSGNVRSPWE